MAEQIMWWAGAVDLLLLIPVLLAVPNAIRLSTQAELLQRQAQLIWAEVEREKVARGITEADLRRDILAEHDRLRELYSAAGATGKERPPVT